MNGTVLVPLDGSTEALAAVPVARGLAALTGGVLRFVHALRGPTLPSSEELLRELKLDPGDANGAVLDARPGDPAEVIVAAARGDPEAATVLTTRVRGPADAGPGPVAERALAAAGGPLVFVPAGRQPRAWRLRNLLLPHDGTPATTAAIGPAASLARVATARLTVLHVADPGGAGPSPEPGSMQAPRYVDEPHHEWPAWAGEFLERLEALHPLEGLQVRFALARGSPGDEVAWFAGASEADLVVVAWHGALGTDRAAVVRTLLRKAPCPVMVLRTLDARPFWGRRAGDRG